MHDGKLIGKLEIGLWLILLTTAFIFYYVVFINSLDSTQLSIDQQVLTKLILKMLCEMELEHCGDKPLSYYTWEYYAVILRIVEKHIYLPNSLSYYMDDHTILIHRVMKRVHEMIELEPDYQPLQELARCIHLYGIKAPSTSLTYIECLNSSRSLSQRFYGSFSPIPYFPTSGEFI